MSQPGADHWHYWSAPCAGACASRACAAQTCGMSYTATTDTHNQHQIGASESVTVYSTRNSSTSTVLVTSSGSSSSESSPVRYTTCSCRRVCFLCWRFVLRLRCDCCSKAVALNERERVRLGVVLEGRLGATVDVCRSLRERERGVLCSLNFFFRRSSRIWSLARWHGGLDGWHPAGGQLASCDIPTPMMWVLVFSHFLPNNFGVRRSHYSAV